MGKIVAFMTREEVNPPDFNLDQPHSEDEHIMSYEGRPQPDLAGIDIAQAALSERDRQRLKLDPGEFPDRQIPPGSWPVVLFHNGKKMLLPPLEFSVQNSQGIDEAVREQVPLILAWA